MSEDNRRTFLVTAPDGQSRRMKAKSAFYATFNFAKDVYKWPKIKTNAEASKRTVKLFVCIDETTKEKSAFMIIQRWELMPRVSIREAKKPKAKSSPPSDSFIAVADIEAETPITTGANDGLCPICHMPTLKRNHDEIAYCGLPACARAIDELGSEDDELCVVCGKPATDDYLDSPCCGSSRCEWDIQVATDYHE